MTTYMFKATKNNNTIKCTLRFTLKGTNRGVHNHHFHASHSLH